MSPCAGLMWLGSVKMQNQRIILLRKFMLLVGLYMFSLLLAGLSCWDPKQAY